LSSAVAYQSTAHRSPPSDTYKSVEAEKSDRNALKKLATRLKTPDSWLRLDDCGCWCISGPAGHVYAYSDAKRWLGGYLIVCHAGDERKWTSIKKALGGTLRQDGDDEGVVLLTQTEINVPAVRKAIGCAR
jgi:hypothetical protein